MFLKYKTIIDTSLLNAENYNSKICDFIINMEGMSGLKTRHFYNNLLNFDDARYLEIGSWKGSSVCSAMYNNNAMIICVDNWSEFGGPKDEFLVNFNKFIGNNNARFIEYDCFKIDVSTLPKFNIFMYDGDHSYDKHYNALIHFYNSLDDIFIYIVDDWNWEHIRNATSKSIKDLNLNILYQKEIRLTNDNSHTPHNEAKISWWNGIYITILQKQMNNFIFKEYGK
jgi:hypothetical protein